MTESTNKVIPTYTMADLVPGELYMYVKNKRLLDKPGLSSVHAVWPSFPEVPTCLHYLYGPASLSPMERARAIPKTIYLPDEPSCLLYLCSTTIPMCVEASRSFGFGGVCTKPEQSLNVFVFMHGPRLIFFTESTLKELSRCGWPFVPVVTAEMG